jgi:hypothetical protein
VSAKKIKKKENRKINPINCNPYTVKMKIYLHWTVHIKKNSALILFVSSILKSVKKTAKSISTIVTEGNAYKGLKLMTSRNM